MGGGHPTRRSEVAPFKKYSEGPRLIFFCGNSARTLGPDYQWNGLVERVVHDQRTKELNFHQGFFGPSASSSVV